MNYKNENATPRSRYEDCAFSRDTQGVSAGCGCGLTTRDTPRRGRPCPYASSHSRSAARGTSGLRNRCGSDNGYVKREAPIAMVYSPMQQWKELYDPHTALSNGTIFKELDLPFYPTPCRRKENSNCHCR